MTRSVEIPDEAVEAATRSLHPGLFEEDGLLHPALANSGRWQKRHEVRAALLAALPYLAPAEVVIDHRPGETCSVAAEVDPETGFARAPAGDGGLREALEQLLRDHAERAPIWDDWVIKPYEIANLLTAHPAAPAVPQPVDRERVADVLREFGHEEDGGGWVLFADELDDFHAALVKAGVFRESTPQPVDREARVFAQAIRSDLDDWTEEECREFLRQFALAVLAGEQEQVET